MITKIKIATEENDDEDFITYAERIILGSVSVFKPKSVFVVKIDNWFGEKWLRFTCKIMGAFGVHSRDLRVPPFVPNRVIYEKQYDIFDGNFKEIKMRNPLHKKQTSECNQFNKISSLYPDTAFFWISGNTAKNGRGSIMCYAPGEEKQEAFYISLEYKAVWKKRFLKGIGQSQMDAIRQAGAEFGTDGIDDE